MQLVFLFHLSLILHTYKISFRCDNFGILNFATKQAVANLLLPLSVCHTARPAQKMNLLQARQTPHSVIPPLAEEPMGVSVLGADEDLAGRRLFWRQGNLACRAGTAAPQPVCMFISHHLSLCTPSGGFIIRNKKGEKPIVGRLCRSTWHVFI